MFWPFTVWGFPKPIFKPHEYWLCKVCCCNSTYRLRYWNRFKVVECEQFNSLLQQYLPFTVLKLTDESVGEELDFLAGCNSTYRLRYWNPSKSSPANCFMISALQQYLPFTVLKLSVAPRPIVATTWELQQYLPFTVLKLLFVPIGEVKYFPGCNSTYRLRYWNPAFFASLNASFSLQQYLPFTVLKLPTPNALKLSFMLSRCNSTYRLRYWNTTNPTWNASIL